MIGLMCSVGVIVLLRAANVQCSLQYVNQYCDSSARPHPVAHWRDCAEVILAAPSLLSIVKLVEIG